MVDIFLIYSFNIVIVIMGVHTYMDMCIHRDSVTGIIVNKESRPSSKVFFQFLALLEYSSKNKYKASYTLYIFLLSLIYQHQVN